MFKIGNTSIENIKVGTTQVQKVYLGTNLVWEYNESSGSSSGNTPSYNFKFKGTFSDTTEYQVNCNGNSSLKVSDCVPSGYNKNDYVNIIIGDCVTTIPNFGFQSCTGLTSLTLSDNITSIGVDGFAGCKNLTSVIIPTGLTSLGETLFSNCTSLTSVTLHSGVTSIGNGTFSKCGFSTISLPSSLTTIGKQAFQVNSNLLSLDIPSGVTSIGNSAFAYCSKLTSLTFHSTTPPTCGTNILDDCKKCYIYVPAASVDTYKAASGFSTYADKIQAIS